jgi:phage terminase Nu1 subunit (DNA packaging protein)
MLLVHRKREVAVGLCRKDSRESPATAMDRAVTRLTEARAELEKLKSESEEFKLLGEEVHDVLTRVRQQPIPPSTS